MVSKLAKKIAYFGTALIGGAIILSSGPKYNIDGSTVKKGLYGYISESKGNDKIRYVHSVPLNGVLEKVVVNGKAYDSKDTLVYPEAEKRYNYLMGKIDSIETANKNAKINEKLAKEKAEAEKDLWVIRK